MPRHSSIIPLSHDHHEALLIALRLKKGGPTSQHDHLWPSDLGQQVRFLHLYFERELLPHFRIEEEILFPAALQLNELVPVIENLLAQHQSMRVLIQRISTISDGAEIRSAMTEFGLLLESHVRAEERELFPKLEEAELTGRMKIPVLK